MSAATAGDCVEIAKLLDAGAKVDGESATFTPLDAACLSGRAEAVQLLVRRRASLRHREPKGSWGVWQPLHYAARSGSVACVSALLDAKADPNARGELDIRPLHIAAWLGDTAVAKVLLERGANPRAGTTWNQRMRTVVGRTERKWDGSVWQWSTNYIDRIPPTLPGVTGSHMVGMPTTGTLCMDTHPLHIAAARGDVDMVRILLQHGANPNAKATGTAEVAPLHLAAEFNHTEAARALLDGGANPRMAIPYALSPIRQRLTARQVADRRPANRAVRELLRAREGR